MAKFLIIDDHDVVRTGIRGLLSELYKSSEVFEASNTALAGERLQERTYDLVFMDIQMPNSDTLSFMEYIRAKYPGTKVLIFSMSPENVYAKRFLKAGAWGFLSKDASIEEIKKVINLTLSNRRYMSDSLAESLIFNPLNNVDKSPFEKLSQREFEIASHLLAGLTLTEVSQLLHLQKSTVGTHKARIFEKLEIDNMMQLKELAIAYNI